MALTGDDDAYLDDESMQDDGDAEGESGAAGGPGDNSRSARRQRRRAQQRITVASTADIQAAIRAATGYKVGPRKAEMLAEFLARKGRAMNNQFNSETAQLGQLLANHTGLCFTGHSHTSDYVPLTAIGPGAELFRGFIQNTDIFRHYTTLAGIRFRNPTDPWSAHSGPPPANRFPVHAENVEEYLLG
jgi:hypothetical protein